MCGIAAVLLHPQARPAEDWQAIRQAFTENLLANESRGKSATGAAVIQSDGRYLVEKAPLPASEFVRTTAYLRLLAQIGPQTVQIFGHTRRPTQGSPEDNANNHPIQAGPVIGVHNGHIQNEADLFQGGNFPRQGQVDSEIIFRLLERVSEPAALNYLAQIKPELNQLRGPFTFLACDLRAPERLLVARHKNPLSLHYHQQWQATLYSSRYLFLRQRFGRQVAAESVRTNSLNLFTAQTLPQLQAQPLDTLELFSPQWPPKPS